MKTLLLFLMVFWIVPLKSQTLVKSQALISSLPFCRLAFSGSEGFPEDLFPENFANPLTQIILREHFNAQDFRLFDKVKKEDFTRGLFKLTEFSENPSALSEETRAFFEKAAAKVPQIMKFVKEAPPEEAPHFQQIALNVLATFSKHLPEALEEGPGADWAQIAFTLKSIADFDETRPRWSLYKIKRAIKKRYDLEEYTKCRIS